MKRFETNHILATALIAVSLSNLGPTAARADSGYWTVNASANWSATTNWLDGVVADGAGNTAYFTNNLSAARTVTLDISRTIGNLTIGRTSGYMSNNLTIGGGQLLTLDNSGNAPVITCWPLKSAGNSAVYLTQGLMGTMGFTKLGTGTLWLEGSNLGMSGDLTIAQGRVFVSYNAYAMGNMSVIVSNGCYLDFYIGGTFSYNNITLNGIGRSQDAQVKSAIYVDNYQNVTLDSSDTITLNATSDFGTAGSSIGQISILTINGTVTGPGGLVKNGSANTLGELILGAGAMDDYAGPTLVSNGVLAVDATLVMSAVTNYSSSYLTGNGYIANSATLLAGATMKPGYTNQIGTLSISNLTAFTGSKLSFLLNPANLTEGSWMNDELLVTNLVVNGPVTNLIAFQTTASPAVGRYVIVEYITASGLTNLTLTSAFASQPYHPGLDLSVPGQIAIVISNSAITEVTWMGGNAANLWDLVKTTNWTDGSNPAVFNNGQIVHFTDSGNNASPVLLKGTLLPEMVSVESSIDYTFAGSGSLSGLGGLQKITGSSCVLTLANATNNYTGATTISAGTLRLGTNNIIPSGTGYGDFALNGATLDMNGFSCSVNDLTGLGAVVDNTSTQGCTLTINDEGPDPVSGSGYAFTGSIGNSGGGPLTLVKTGPSMLTWRTGSGPFTYTGGTIINGGRVLVNPANAFGSGSVTVSNGAWVSLYGPSVSAPVTNDFYLYSVGITWSGQMYDTITCGTYGTNTVSGTIHLMSTANLGGWGTLNSPFAGTLIASGQISGPGALQMSSLAGADNNMGILELDNPANDFAGGLLLYAGRLRCGASGVIPSGPDKGDVSMINPTNASLPQTTLDLNGSSETVNGLSGKGVVTNMSPTPASLIVGNNDANGTFSGSIGGAIAVQKIGAGAWLLDGTNTYTDGTTVSAGALGGSGVLASAVSVQASATLAPGDATVGALTINGDLTINGNLRFKLDKSSPLTSDLVVVSGSLQNGGTGTLAVTNLGPALVSGDTFVLFSQPLSNGGALTIAGPAGVTFANLLAANGSIQVLSAPTATNPTNLVFSISSGTLQLSWPADHLGWYAQSNSVGLANSNFWFDIPGSQMGTNLSITINPSLPQMFYRMHRP